MREHTEQHHHHHHTEPWEKNIRRLMGKPVGISFKDGRGTSGILCDANDDELYIYEYLYRDQFAIKHYGYHSIQDIHPFPSCTGNARRKHTVF